MVPADIGHGQGSRGVVFLGFVYIFLDGHALTIPAKSAVGVLALRVVFDDVCDFGGYGEGLLGFPTDNSRG